jgi:N-acyl-D-amino-acid deacylase
MHDILIKNGTIFDGTGKERFSACIAINDGVITEMGDLSGDSAREVIDAKGLFVAPGFIDISNRSDTRWRLFSDPHLESMLHQGVTTIIGGNSGSSLAPIYSEDMLKSIRKWGNVTDININWQTMREFLDAVESHHISVNFGSFVGYGTLRRGLTGDESRELTSKEQVSIKKHIIEALDRGALGVSTGLVYSHEKDVTEHELKMIGQITKKKNRLFVAHLRNEDDQLLEALDEMLKIQKATKTKMHISHLKAMMKNNWPSMRTAIKKIEETSVLFDVYPYTFSETVLYTLLPNWVSEGGRRMMIERLRNKKLRPQITNEMAKNGPDLSRAIVAHTQRSHYFCGKTFGEIARKQNSSIEDVVIDVLLASEGQVMIFFESVSEENIVHGLESAHSIISSNGVGYTVKGRNEQLVHPRSFGAFPHVFSRYVQRDGVMSVEEMIYKCSGKVAEELNITDRGVIENGRKADIIVFDPKDYIDHSTAEKPYQYATGINWVLVNGQMTIKYGKHTGIRAGHVIRG